MRFGWFAKSFSPHVASIRLRLLGPAAALRARGVDVEPWRAAHAAHYDALIFAKSFTKTALRIAHAAAATGRPIIVDMCDNDLEKADRKRRPEKRARIVEQLERATIVTVATAALGEQIAEQLPGVAPKLRVVPDMLDDLGSAPGPSIADRLRLAELERFLGGHAGAVHLVWFGNSSGDASGFSHLVDIIPMIERFAESRPATLTIISDDGARYHQASAEWRLPRHYLPWSLGSFGAALAMHRVALIPIRRNGYTVGKSINRPATALLAGLGVVADAIDSYEELRPFIALDDWASGLLRYADRWEEEQPRLAAARAHLQRRYGPDAVAGYWKPILDELEERVWPRQVA